jgi:hypothetical protein
LSFYDAHSLSFALAVAFHLLFSLALLLSPHLFIHSLSRGGQVQGGVDVRDEASVAAALAAHAAGLGVVWNLAAPLSVGWGSNWLCPISIDS